MSGCTKGCLFLLVIGFLSIILVGVVGNQMSEMEWQKTRVGILSAARQAVDAQDYRKALSLAEPYESRNDPELNSLIANARLSERQALEKARDERVFALIAEIKGTQGKEREEKLVQLLTLSPNTKEFPEELAGIRDKIKQREKEIRAKAEAERQVELARKEKEREEQARLAVEARLAEFKWKYHVTNDELTSKPTYMAIAQSLNQVNFDFPYQGLQRGDLMLRTHPQYGKDLIVRVEKGQMLVASYNDTTIKAVFDDSSPISYSAVGPSDHGTTSLFIRDYQGFVGRMLKAKKVKISVPFYQQGNVVFEFNVSDFSSDKYLGKK